MILRSHLIYTLIVMFPSISIASAAAAGEETLIGIKGHDFIMLGADSSVRSSISLTSTNIDKIRVLIDPFPVISYPDQRMTQRQQAIVAAIAGDSADADRLLGLLAAHASLVEFDAGLGCDIQTIYEGGQVLDENRYLESPAGLDAESLSYFARSEIASHLRSSNRYNVCLLVAGMVRCVSRSHGNMQKQDIPLSFSQTIQKQVKDATKSALDDEKQFKSLDSSAIMPLEDIDYQSHGEFLVPKLYWLDEYGSRQNLDYGAHGLGANFALSILDQNFRPDLTREEATSLIKNCFQQLRQRFVINSPSLPCIKCIDARGCHLIIP